MNWVNIEIARIHLLAKKKQTFIAMLGVTFGIAMFILMISFMNGVNEFLEDTMLSSTPDVRIYNDIQTDFSHSILDEISDTSKMINVVHHPRPKDINPNVRNAQHIIDDLKINPRVTAISPQLSTQVFYNSGPVQINGVLSGVNILEEAKLTKLNEKIKTGKMESLLTYSNGLLMGQGLANKLNVREGDWISLATPKGTFMRFRIIGTFQFGVGAIDNIKSFVSLSKVQQLLGKDNQYITDINIKFDHNDDATVMAADFSKRYNNNSEDWKTANASAMVSILIRNVMTLVVSITLLTVAGFGIYNIMNMTIQNKLKDIAILKAEGFSGSDIRQIFLFQSITIGVLGALLGSVFGFLLSYLVYTLPFPKNDFIILTHFPVTFHIRYYIFGIAFGVVTTFFAGLMPSIKASKVDPVVILRG